MLEQLTIPLQRAWSCRFSLRRTAKFNRNSVECSISHPIRPPSILNFVDSRMASERKLPPHSPISPQLERPSRSVRSCKPTLTRGSRISCYGFSTHLTETAWIYSHARSLRISGTRSYYRIMKRDVFFQEGAD